MGKGERLERDQTEPQSQPSGLNLPGKPRKLSRIFSKLLDGTFKRLAMQAEKETMQNSQ